MYNFIRCQITNHCKALLPVAELNIALVSIDPDNPIMLKGDPANPPAADVEFCCGNREGGAEDGILVFACEEAGKLGDE